VLSLFIQRAEYDGAGALQAKLGQLLRASASAEDDIAMNDDKELEQMEKERSARHRRRTSLTPIANADSDRQIQCL